MDFQEELHCAGQLVAGEEMTQFARERNIKGSASSVVAGAFQLASKFTSWALGLAGSRSKLYMRNIEEGLTLIWAPLVVVGSVKFCSCRMN